MNEPFLTSDAVQPPRWAAAALRLLVAARDRESIAGDLVEEYREAILPRLGRAGARWWYWRQVLSLVSGVRFGLALGVMLALGAVGGNVVLPLAKVSISDSDDPTPVAIVCLGLWGAAGLLAWWRTGRLAAAVRAGGTAALVSMGIVMLTFFVIDNVFLDLVSRQPEKIWQFQHSHLKSMRASLNYGHARGVVLVLPLLTLAGAACGAAGGLAGRLASSARATRKRA